MSNELAEWRDKHLNSVSCSFCAAKWYNASLHLGHGYTNSCHLPLPHPIDVEAIKTNQKEYIGINTLFSENLCSAEWTDTKEYIGLPYLILEQEFKKK